MATQNDSNELRVEHVDEHEIEQRLQANNIDIASVVFEAEQMEKALDGTDSSNSSGDAAAAGAKVEFKDGKAANIVQRMVPITQTMSTPAQDLDDSKKEKIKNKAEKSKAEKDKARDGIGE